jgi:nanoRNase/pAp phosphatase (c-di-AMP/oligoRNAs hydrolase)
MQLASRPDVAIGEGAAILRAANQYVERQAPNACLCEIAGYVVPVINTTHQVSELVGRLAEGQPFAASWFERQDGKFVYSLRSRGDGGEDVSTVAKLLGGGGHRNAAGFTSATLVHRRPQ